MIPVGLAFVAATTAVVFTVAMVLLYHWLFRPPNGGESIRAEVEP